MEANRLLVTFIWAGCALALGLAGLSGALSLRGGGYYSDHIYRISPQTHRRYACLGVFCAVVSAGTVLPALRWFAIYAFAATVIITVFYASSFARGFSDEDDA